MPGPLRGLAEAAPNGTPQPAVLRILEQLEQYAVALICSASGLYILRCLPAFLFPQGALLTLLILAAGALLGVAALVGALVYAFYMLTLPAARAGNAPPRPEQLPYSGSGRHARGRGRDVTAAADVPPHAFCKHGELSGVVYTAGLSRFGPEDTMAVWPPATAGPGALARRWRAALSQGTLVLTPMVEAESPQQPARRATQRQQAAAGEGGGGGGDGCAAGGDAVQEAAAAAGTENEGGGDGVAEPSAAPLKVGIPLEGCTVEVVTGGLCGRSQWIRRAPLLVTHPKWNLLDGEQGFYLFAEDPASKQAWYHALSWWCGGAGAARGTAVEALYAAYCAIMARRSALEYPQESLVAAAEPAEGNGGSGGSGSDNGAAPPEAAAPAAGRRTWKAWGAQKMQVVKKRVQERRGRGGRLSEPALPSPLSTAAPLPEPPGLAAATAVQQPPLAPLVAPAPTTAAAEGSVHGEAAAAAAQPSQPGTPGAPLSTSLADLPPGLDCIEAVFDARWMQSTKIPLPLAIPQAVSRPLSPARPPRRGGAEDSGDALPPGSGYNTPARGGSPQRPRSSPAPALLGAAPSPALLPRGGSGGAEEGLAVPGAMVAPGLPRPQSLPGTPLHPLGPAAGAAVEPFEAAATPTAAAAGPASATWASPAKAGSEAVAATSIASVAKTGPDGAERGGAGVQRPAAAGGVGVPPGMPPLLAADYGLNMLLTRAGFDLLRNPAFKAMLQQRIQRRLSLLQTPDYVQTLEVVDVALGHSIPTVRNFAALPTPDEAVWPQMAFDIYYQGTFTITLETKLDIRDAAAWGRLDRALSRLEGRGGGPTVEALRGHAGASGAASSPELGGSSMMAEVEGEEEGGDSPLAKLGGEDGLGVEASGGSGASCEGGAGEGPQGGAAGAGAVAQGRQLQQRGQFMNRLRASAGRRIRQLAETTATKISRIPLRMSLTFSVLEGTMLAWVPPPPGNRLFISFLRPPKLVVMAKPELGGRLLKYSYHMARVSTWVELRMRAALTKNMVFPGGADFVLPALMDWDNPHVADPLPGLPSPLASSLAAAAAAATAASSPAVSPRKCSRSAPQLSQPELSASSQPGGSPWQQLLQQGEEEGEAAGVAPRGPAPVGNGSGSGTEGPRQSTAVQAVPIRAAPASAGAAGDNGGDEQGTRGLSTSWPERRAFPAPVALGRVSASGAAAAPSSSNPSSARRVTKSVSFGDPPEQQQQAPAAPPAATAAVGGSPLATAAAGALATAAQATATAACTSSVAGTVAAGAPQGVAVGQGAAKPGAGSAAAGGVVWRPAAASAPAVPSAEARAGLEAGVAGDGEAKEEEPLEGLGAFGSIMPAGSVAFGADVGVGEAAELEGASALPHSESGHFIGGRAASAGLEVPAQADRAESLTTGRPGSKLVSKGLDYLRQHSSRTFAAAASSYQGAAGPEAGGAGAEGPRPAAGQGAAGIKAQGRRMAGLMLSRAKAFAQQVQQAQQQARQQQQAQAPGGGMGRAHSE